MALRSAPQMPNQGSTGHWQGRIYNNLTVVMFMLGDVNPGKFWPPGLLRIGATRQGEAEAGVG